MSGLDVGEIAGQWRGHLTLVHGSPASSESIGTRAQRIVDELATLLPFETPPVARAAGTALLIAAHLEIRTGRVHPEAAQVIAEAGLAFLDSAAHAEQEALLGPDGAG